jgi:hypothetical protein
MENSWPITSSKTELLSVGRAIPNRLLCDKSPPKDYSALGIWVAIIGLAVTVAVFKDSLPGVW